LCGLPAFSGGSADDEMNIKFLLSNFDFKEEVSDQGKTLMKRRKYLRALLYGVLWVVLTFGKALFGQSAYNSSQVLAPLTDSGGSARAVAMGSAFVGVADDSSALLWNPAGLGNLPQGDLTLHHNFWLANGIGDTLMAGIPLQDRGGIGVMVNYMDFGTIQGRGYLTNPTPIDNEDFMIGWGKEWVPNLYVGLALERNSQTGLNQTYYLFGGDLGLLYRLDNHLRLGAAFINLGGNPSDALIAPTLEVGASYRLNLGKSHSFLLSLEGNLETPNNLGFGAGLEYGFQSRYFLRVGLPYSDENFEIKHLPGITSGAGVRLGDIQIDYALLPYGYLGVSNRISFSYLFGLSQQNSSISPRPTPEPANASPPVGTFKPNPGKGPQQEVLTLQFDLPPDLVAQGQALEAQGRRREAMDLYKEELAKDNQDAAAWYYLGVDYFQLGQNPEALQCFEQVLKLKTNDKAFTDWLEKYKATLP
jgi:tetratricopeptide (TPR) repeat protein